MERFSCRQWLKRLVCTSGRVQIVGLNLLQVIAKDMSNVLSFRLRNSSNLINLRSVWIPTLIERTQILNGMISLFIS